MTFEETVERAKTLPGYRGMLHSQKWESAIIVCREDNFREFVTALDLPLPNDQNAVSLEIWRSYHVLAIIPEQDHEKMKYLRDAWLRCDGIFAELDARDRQIEFLMNEDSLENF